MPYKDKEKQKEWKRINDIKRREKRRAFLNTYLENGCSLGIEKEFCCLEFHHIDPSKKEFDVGTTQTHAMKRLLEEIDKCIVICSNCHHKVHAGLLKI